MKLKYKMRRGFTLVELLVVIAIIATLAGVGVPVIIDQRKKGDRSEALRNGKSVALALFTFENDFGSFPSSGEGGTATQVQEANPNSGYTFGTQNSNDFFRQLIAAGHTDSETIFYAKAPYTKKPDSNVKGDRCLAAGEVGFAYIMATENEPIPSSSKSGCPLIAAAVYNGANDGTFDPDLYGDRKAVVIFLDQSGKELTIRPSDKKIPFGGSGRTLLQGGSDETVWGTDINPILKAPKKATGGG
jgi:prepilin-type N-terminal cleavage/methylation domain-containing protein